MVKKYCALKELDSLGTCRFTCNNCTWSMSRKEIDCYVERQKKDLLNKELINKYGYHKGVK